MKMHRTIVILLLSFVVVSFSRDTIKLYRITSVANKSKMNLTIVLKNPGTANYTVDLNAYLFKTVPRVTIYIKLGLPIANEYSHVITNTTINLCSYLNNKNSNRILKAIYTGLYKYGDIPKKCPIEPGLYYLKDMQLPNITFPKLFPVTKWEVTCSFYDGRMHSKNLGFRSVWYGEIY